MRRSSQETKAAILHAAQERFAADGYDRTTIRAVAADAGIDPSMVMRYFGSKQLLFARAADFDLRLPDLSDVPLDQVGQVIAGHLIDRWEADNALRILLRTAVTNDEAAQRMRSIFGTQVAPVINKVTSDPAEAAKRAGLVATQALGLALCRYVLRLPPVVAMNREDVIEWLGPTLHRYIHGRAE